MKESVFACTVILLLNEVQFKTQIEKEVSLKCGNC